ncbi:MAG: sulfatase-like hydrolase/transferase [Chitinophagales bacterium]
MKKLILFFFSIFLITNASFADCPLPAPANLTPLSKTSCSITITWKAVNGAASYKLRYKLKASSTWIKVNAGNTTAYTVSGLSSVTPYDFSVASVCPNNNAGVFSNIISVKTNSCSLPNNPEVSNITSASAHTTWMPVCPASSYILRYKKTANSVWNKVGNIMVPSYTIIALEPQTNYEVQVRSACSADTSAWTESVTFLTLNAVVPAHPNIVMILLDDARYDAFKPNGGPSYLNYPSIDRIANEGVNFKYFLPTSSQCTPSRGTILTGLYAHKHGAVSNKNNINTSIPQIQEILHDNGYFTGVIGKYTFSNNPDGCDWYAVSASLAYIDPHLFTNGIHKDYPGHVTDVYSQLLGAFFDSIPANKPFFLMFWPISPHGPSIPRDQDTSFYVNQTMPFPSNFYKYPKNYPRYYYTFDQRWDFNASQTDSMRLIEFQTQQGTDMNVDTILTRLENMGILDSTMVIFTSDNGYMKGEHLMAAKQVALEESIRLPLFIRYPAWFMWNTVVTDQIGSNMDLAPTILEAANIPDTFKMDGISLHQLFNGTIPRKDFLYEYCSQEALPPIRAVRSVEYKYIYSFCDQTTEEFYDLIIDPKENTNQIFNPAYTSLIQEYRNKKDSLRVVFNDTISEIRHCSLAKIQMRNSVESESESEYADVNGIYLFPSPADQRLQLRFFVGKNMSMLLTVKNEMGETMVTNFSRENGWIRLVVDCSNWLPGAYFAFLLDDEEIRTCKMMVMH